MTSEFSSRVRTTIKPQCYNYYLQPLLALPLCRDIKYLIRTDLCGLFGTSVSSLSQGKHDPIEYQHIGSAAHSGSQ